MIAVSQTKSANYLFIVAVLKSMREGGVITQAEYERAKRYYQKLTGSDLVIADYPDAGRLRVAGRYRPLPHLSLSV